MNKFKHNLGVVAIASVISFAISLALTPIMTRIYAPSDYGVFAILNNLATLVATLVIMSLPNALPLEGRIAKREQIVRTILHLGVLAFVVTFILTLTYVVSSDRKPFNRVIWSAPILPFLVVSIIFHRLAQGWVNAKGDFRSMATARVVHPLVGKLGAVGASFSMGAYPIFLLLFEAVGYFVQMRIMFGAQWRQFFFVPKVFSFRRWHVTLGIINCHRDMAFFGNVSNLLALSAIAIESMIVAKYFSIEETGLFSLAMSMVSLPVQLVALATASVVYHKFIEISRVNPEGLFRVVKIAFFGYLVVGLPIYALIYQIGPDLFSFAFGEKWRESGHIASLLVFPLLLTFIAMPLSSVLRIAKKQRIALLIDAILLPGAIAIFLIFSISSNLTISLISLAIAMSFHQLILITFYLATARQMSTTAAGHREN